MGQCQNYTSDMWANARITTLTCGSMPELHTSQTRGPISELRLGRAGHLEPRGQRHNCTSNSWDNVRTAVSELHPENEGTCQNETPNKWICVSMKYYVEGRARCTLCICRGPLACQLRVSIQSVEDQYPVS